MVRERLLEVLALQNRAYRYTVEGSSNASSYHALVDRSANTIGGTMRDPVGETLRYVRLTFTGAANYTGNWISIAEVRLIQTSP